MKKILNLYKKEGETPLETIERFKMENSEYKNEKMTYAGRLDPMAEGVLLVLVGEECKNKEKYLGVDKEYEFEILWGFATDTYDILGLPKLAFWYSAEYQNANFGTRPFDSQINKTFLRYAELKNVNVGEKKFGFDFNLKLEKSIKNLEGKFEQEYPPYSSKTVGGKQLFQWAREGRMDEIEIPKREVEIYDIEYLGDYEITKKDLLKNIVERINKVTGDFRQKEIIQEWEKIPEARTLGKCVENFVISKFKVKCSSGTYVRAIVNRLGNELGVGTTTFRIKRTGVGEFKMKN